MNKRFDFPADKNYFLVPGMPTPNGRIHLGHIAGPYLRMDVFKRKAQRNNGSAYLCSGSDVYESYVELKASQLKMSTKEVANHFHELILKDFKALDIEFDLFINPLEENLQDEFISFHQSLLQDLISNGNTIEKYELIPYDTANERYLTGCWIKGICPICKNETGGYLCEKCGYHYRPEDIFNNEDYSNIELIRYKAIYLNFNVNTVLENTKRVQNGIYMPIVEKYIELQGPFIRLTTLQHIGVPFVENHINKQVIFTYPGLLFYSIYCGHLLQKKLELKTNPMANHSKFISCASFGLDNIIPFLTGVYGGGIALSNYKPFDHYFCNFFYSLNGSKFSTSRSHVIWSGDIVELCHIQSDAVRYYLCKVNPELNEANFDTKNFVETINKDLHSEMNIAIQIAFDNLRIDISYPCDTTLFSLIENIILTQDQLAAPDCFQLSTFLQPIKDWIQIFEKFDEIKKTKYAYWWVKTLAYLCYPVIPNSASALWGNLTQEKEISRNTFFTDDRVISQKLDNVLFKSIQHDDLMKILH
jgi:methionyl-tRNA synthetase